MATEIKNGTIEQTFLGQEGHGIPSCMITIDLGGSAQGFGGYDLRVWGIKFIDRTLAVLGVDCWEHLVGKHVRVRADYNKIYAIGHIVKDDWFEPEAENPAITKSDSSKD